MTNKQAYAGLLERLVGTKHVGRLQSGIPVVDFINPDGPEAAEAISSLLKRVGELEDHIREQITHVETRIADGKELGASVWRIALEDIARENRTALNSDAPLSIGEGDRG